jgi:hypothetical protein
MKDAEQFFGELSHLDGHNQQIDRMLSPSSLYAQSPLFIFSGLSLFSTKTYTSNRQFILPCLCLYKSIDPRRYFLYYIYSPEFLQEFNLLYTREASSSSSQSENTVPAWCVAWRLVSGGQNSHCLW